MLMTYVSMHNIQWNIFQGRICSTCELPSTISMIFRKCPLVWGLILLTLELLKEFVINASDVWTDIISWIPTHHELRPLLGGVNWLSFRVRLIDRCWKRKRWKGPHSNRLSRSALLRKQSRDTMCWNHGWSSTSTAPTSEITVSEGAIDSFLYSLDVLRVQNLCHPWESEILYENNTAFPSNDLEIFCSRIDPLAIRTLQHLIFPVDTRKIAAPMREAENLRHQMARAETCFDPVLSPIQSALYSSLVPDGASPSAFRINARNSDSMPIVIDTGASRSLSPIRKDFITFSPLEQSLQGISADAKIEGVGVVSWEIIDENGVAHFIETEAFFVPTASIRLYSPQFHFKEKLEGSLLIDHHGAKLTLANEGSGVVALSFPYNGKMNLPLMLKKDHPYFLKGLFGSTEKGFACDIHHVARENPLFESFDPTIPDQFGDLRAFLLDAGTANLKSSEYELLSWHCRMGHVGMSRLQKLMSWDKEKPLDHKSTSGHLEKPIVFRTNFKKTQTTSPIPVCHACALANMTRLSPRSQRTRNNPDREMVLARGHLYPGDAVSIDQYVVAHKGRRYDSFGKERESDKQCGGTIFVDHASGKVFVYHQRSLRATDTIIGKRYFERMAFDAGIRIKRYHADNGIFVSEEFRNELELKEQVLDLSGVGAHFQNGKSERHIRTICALARAMMIHSALHWPDSHNLDQWPMAMDHAVWIWNNLPSEGDGISPEEKFTRQKAPNYNHLRAAHVWGSPCYVLDPKLQDGHKIPKWSPRSRQGQFLGYSKEHASTVGLVRNVRTGRITPQFHVLYDDYFQTVAGTDAEQAVDLERLDWDGLIRTNGTDRAFDESEVDEVPDISDEWLTQDEITARQQRRVRFARQHVPTVTRTPIRPRNIRPAPISPPTEIPNGDGDDEEPSSPVGRRIDFEPSTPEEIATARHQAQQQNTTRKSRRLRNESPEFELEDNPSHIPRATPSFYTRELADYRMGRKYSAQQLEANHFNGLDWEGSVSLLASSLENGDCKRFFASMDVYQDPLSLELDELSPLAFITRASAADNPRFHEAIAGSNKEGFWDAMQVEIDTLAGLNSWDQVKRTHKMNVIPSTWAFKVKRYPDGLVRKLKARFCVRGDTQIEGVDFFDTYAPVVSWTTVRIMMILSIILDLKTKQVDYVSAFCQAPIDTEVFVAPPQGWRTLNRIGLMEPFKGDDHVLRLNRSVYGLRQSPKNFFEYLKGNLKTAGFTPSKLDPCLFISDKVICLVYVDDCLFYSATERNIDDAIGRIKDTGMDLEVEDSVGGFLGISITNRANQETGLKEIQLLQTGLIDRVITALGLDENSNGLKVPAPTQTLPKDPEGVPFDGEFSYPSVVGMAMYLCNNSRPDIAFAIHQCARHTHNPTQLHAEHLKRVGRYLKETRDKGLIFKMPSATDKLKIDCFVDADFAGLWNSEDHNDPHSVRSRTGYVILVNDAPVVWSSKLQTETACSTMESEYIALSTACKELIPLRRLVAEIADAVGMERDKVDTMHTTIWEDNVGALTLANLELPRLTPRSKSFGVKYHWFREHIHNPEMGITVVKVDTKDQLADIFTKGLVKATFEHIRKKLMGW